jgi:hypothetical protein
MSLSKSLIAACWRAAVTGASFLPTASLAASPAEPLAAVQAATTVASLAASLIAASPTAACA